MDTFALNLISTDFGDASDIDELFEQLEIIEPPVDMVERIMDAVSQLPLPQTTSCAPLCNFEVLAINPILA
jgi:hypothetical protein